MASADDAAVSLEAVAQPRFSASSDDAEAAATSDTMPLVGGGEGGAKGSAALGGGGGGGGAVVTERSAGIGLSIFNMSNTIIGAGILGLPYAVGNCGVVLGAVLLVVMAALSLYSLHSLAAAGELTGVYSYEQLGQLAYGRAGRLAVQIPIALNTFGCLVSYITVVRDLVLPLLASVVPEGNLMANCAFVLFLVTAVFMLPLAMLKKFTSLAWFGFVSVLLVLFFAVVLVYYLGAFRLDQLPSARLGYFSTDIFLALPVYAFTFQCQAAFFPMYAELKDGNTRRMDIVCAASLAICVVIYLLVGVCGYLAFPVDTDPNIILAFDAGMPLIVVMRVAFAVTMVLTFPVMSFPLRQTVDMILFPRRRRSNCRLYALAVVLVVLSYVVAIAVPNVGIVFDLSGAMASTLLVYVLPPLLRLRAFKLHQQRRLARKTIAFSVCLAVFGTLAGISGTVTTIVHIAEGRGLSHSCFS